MVEELKEQGGYLCTDDEKAKLENWMWQENKDTGAVGLNLKVVAQSACKIASDAGLDVPDSTKMLMVFGNGAGIDRYSGEKISPVMALWKCKSFDEGLDMVMKMHEYAGIGHSAGLYTFNQDYIHKAAAVLKVSRVLVRQAHAPSAGGNLWNGMPSTVTLGCGTWGGNITTENIHWKHFINVTWLTEPIEAAQVTDEDLFGAHWTKYGQ